MRKKEIIIVLFCLISSFILTEEVHAVKTTRTISYFGGYVADAQANTPYSKTFTFKAPDGISQLYYAKGIIKADMTTTNTRVYAQVDGEYCDPSYYDVPTNEKDYLMMFDCTSVAHGEGQYEAGFQANKNIKNVYADWEFTYLNNPAVELEDVYERTKAKINVFGTEYVFGEKGTIFIQVIENATGVDDASCFMDVYYPDKTLWLEKTSMVHLDKGIYYIDIITPDKEGIYISTAYCYYLVTTNQEYADGESRIYGTTQSGSMSNLNTDDGSYYILKEENNGTANRLESDFSFNNITILNETDLREIDVLFNGQFDGAENMGFWVYNFNSSSWEKLPNEIGYTTTDVDVTNAITVNMINYISSGQVRVKIKDTDETDTANKDLDTFRPDQLIVQIKYSPETITEIRGGGEIHISESSTQVDLLPVGGTEYAVGDLVTQSIQLLDIQGRPIYTKVHPPRTVLCNITIYDESMNVSVNDSQMTEIPETGLFYYQKVFNETGLYTSYFHCKNTHGATSYFGYGSNEFHVSRWASGVMNMTQNGTLTNIYTLNYVGGTEYKRGELGHLAYQFLRTVAGSPTPINDGTCNMTVWYPNKTIWLNKVGLIYLSGSNGLYYKHITVPDVEGVYETDIKCVRKGVRTYSASTFHVAPWANQIYNLTNIVETGFVDIQSKIEDHNFTMYDFLKAHNQSIWSKLYRIQDEIAILGQNVTNISIEILANMTTLPKDVYFYFDKVEEKLIFNHDYCLNDNVTLRKELMIEKCYDGDCWNMTRNEDKVCPFGCDPEMNKCNPQPYMRWLIIIGIVIGIIILVIFINWLIGKFEWFGVKR